MERAVDVAARWGSRGVVKARVDGAKQRVQAKTKLLLRIVAMVMSSQIFETEMDFGGVARILWFTKNSLTKFDK